MTLASAPPTTGTSVADWLLPTSEETRIKLETVVMQTKAIEEPRARPLRTLNAVARHALAEEIEAKLRAIMGETFADLVIGGWRTHTAIAQAVRRSRTQPGVDQIVALRQHTITVHRHHDLDIELDSVRMMTLTAKLAVRLQLYDAVAVVRDGQLVAVRSGQAKADGTLTVDGVQVAQRTLPFPLTAELALHAPRDV